ncbi:MAG: hypothetical protein RR578_01710, partial [Bacilli bacterium]
IANKPDEKPIIPINPVKPITPITPITPIAPIKPETPSTGDQTGVVPFIFIMSGAFLVLFKRSKALRNNN